MKTVVVGMSGGVDSSVTALLLKKQGYRVIGLHMKNQNSAQETKDEVFVKDLCEKLGIEYKIVSFEDEMEKVKSYFITEYKSGRTPNPCVMCNKNVKFKPFIDFANQVGADFYATGHYAKIVHENGVHTLKKALDSDKDQTYFLNQLSQSQLEKALFPLGEIKKTEVRKIAEENGLMSAHKKDSFDVCFVGSQKFKDYMNKICPEKSGKIVDIETNKVVGKHNGISKFTFGQRKGLGVGGQKDELGRWFVVKKDIENNVLYVSTNEEKYLFSKNVLVKSFNWIPKKPNQKEFDCFVKVRYRQPDQKAHIIINDDESVSISFEVPQRAVTAGQYAVLYTQTDCLGGGVIDSAC